LGCLLELVEENDREGSLRTDEISAEPRASAVVSERRRSNASGDWYSLMSTRISRSAEPNRNSARVFAISVFPVPVGPTKGTRRGAARDPSRLP
jgi:hypothetical protein